MAYGWAAERRAAPTRMIRAHKSRERSTGPLGMKARRDGAEMRRVEATRQGTAPMPAASIFDLIRRGVAFQCTRLPIPSGEELLEEVARHNGILT